jgi:Holliday junction resolvase RusA-like endonuclease
MKTLLDVWITGPAKAEPRAKARAFVPKGGSKPIARLYHPRRETAQTWRTAILEVLKRARVESPLPLEGPLALALTFVFETPKSYLRKDGTLRPGLSPYKGTKPDLDNLEKLVMDVMTHARLWRDDGQVAWKFAEKFWGAIPGVRIVLGRPAWSSSAGNLYDVAS